MRNLKNDFKTPNKETYYDLFEDYDLIEASFAEQYGIRLRIEDEMTWDEFVTLLSGINYKTPLGQVVTVRAEKDPKIIKNFTPEQKRIKRDWERRKANEMSRDDFDKAMKQLELAFKNMNKK